MEQLTWSDGSKPIKSLKEDKIKFVDTTSAEQPSESTDFATGSIFRETSNRREDANDKISEREPIGQVCQNPFLTNTNYIDDLDVQEKFLTPKSSHT